MGRNAILRGSAWTLSLALAFSCGGGGGGSPDDGATDADLPVDTAFDADAGPDPADTAGDTPVTDSTADPDALHDAADVPADTGTDAADWAEDWSGEGCVPVDVPHAISLYPMPGEAVPGRSEAVVEGSFHDEYLYDSSDAIKVGVRREWGGTIVYFGLSSYGAGMNEANVIDANDTGREVQVAFYDPDRRMQNCAWDATCATGSSDCPESITYLGWDPVQGGNRCNIGSGVDWLLSGSGILYLQTTPLFWNPNWDFTDCTSTGCDDSTLRSRRSDVEVKQRLRFVSTRVVELTYELTNLSDVAHAATEQEMPTVYTANGGGGTQDVWRLFDSEGTQIAIDTPAGGDGFFYENMASPDGWVSMQNDAANYGVGIYYENGLTGFQGWQLRSLPFNNVRARFSFGIPANGTVFARAYLLLGSYATISADAEWLIHAIPPFGVIDSPVDDEALSGVETVHGWVLDNLGVASVALRVDGAHAATLGYGGSRPDVCSVWPGYPGCDLVGYSGSFDFSTLTACHHLIEVVATDTDGNVRTIAARRVIVSG